MMQVSEQFVRVSIFAGKIPGAFYLEGENGKRGQYYVTDAQITNLMEGEKPCKRGECSQSGSCSSHSEAVASLR